MLTDPIDDFWIQAVNQFQEKSFKSVTRAGADLDTLGGDADKDKDAKGTDKAKDAPGMDALVARIKVALGDAVKDVRASSRLTDSAVCLVAGEGDMDIHMERILKQHGQLGDGGPSLRILEVNPTHPLIEKLAGTAQESSEGNPALDDAAFLLFDQARILEGENPSDPQAFARRISQMMEKGLAL